MNNKLYISSKAFWDVDFDKLIEQAEKFPDYIIRKVFEYGTFNDVINTVNYFGKQKAIESLTSAGFLNEKTLHFVSVFFKIEKSNFKCFTNKQQRHFYSKRSKI